MKDISWVRKDKKYGWVLTRAVQYDVVELSGDPKATVGYNVYRDKKTKNILVRCEGRKLTVYPGYAWDGCSVVGKIPFMESYASLAASLPHDVLYQVHQQPGKNAGLYPCKWFMITQTQADKIFLNEAKERGVTLIKRNLWYAAVIAVGSSWWDKTVDTLYVGDLESK